MEKTLAQEANHNFDDGYYNIYDNKNEIYFENSDGFWEIKEYDKNFGTKSKS